MDVGKLLADETIPRFKSFYVKYEAVEQQLNEGISHKSGNCTLLRYFLHKLGGPAAMGQEGSNGSRVAAKVVDGPQDAVAQVIDAELQRLNRFVAAQLEESWMRLLGLYEAVPASLRDTATASILDTGTLLGANTQLSKAGESEGSPLAALQQKLKEFRLQCDALGLDLVLLDEFVRQNAAACACLASRRDLLLAQPSADTAAEQSSHASSVDCGRSSTQPAAGESTTALPDASPGAGSETSLVTAARSAGAGKKQGEGSYAATMMKLLMGKQRFDPLLIGLSDLYAHLRQLSKDLQHLDTSPAKSSARPQWTEEGAWRLKDTFRQQTSKFWVLPADVLRVKCQIMRHMPLLLVGRRVRLTPGRTNASRYLEHERARDSYSVSSVYLDNANLDAYQERLARKDKAAVVRIRWYNHRDPESAQQQLFVERKELREHLGLEYGIKQRIGLRQEQLAPLLSRQASADSMTSDPTGQALLEEVQRRGRARKEERVLRTMYHRTAYQERDSDAVRVSLDTNVCMAREIGAPRAAGDWCWDLSLPLGSDEFVSFPYAILEVKLEEDIALPPWMVSLMTSGLVATVPRFSKYLHGACMLFPVPRRPYWFVADPAGGAVPATFEDMEDSTEPIVKQAVDRMLPDGSMPSRVRLRRKARRLLKHWPLIPGTAIDTRPTALANGSANMEEALPQLPALLPPQNPAPRQLSDVKRKPVGSSSGARSPRISPSLPAMLHSAVLKPLSRLHTKLRSAPASPPHEALEGGEAQRASREAAGSQGPQETVYSSARSAWPQASELTQVEDETAGSYEAGHDPASWPTLLRSCEPNGSPAAEGGPTNCSCQPSCQSMPCRLHRSAMSEPSPPLTSEQLQGLPTQTSKSGCECHPLSTSAFDESPASQAPVAPQGASAVDAAEPAAADPASSAQAVGELPPSSRGPPGPALACQPQGNDPIGGIPAFLPTATEVAKEEGPDMEELEVQQRHGRRPAGWRAMLSLINRSGALQRSGRASVQHLPAPAEQGSGNLHAEPLPDDSNARHIAALSASRVAGYGGGPPRQPRLSRRYSPVPSGLTSHSMQLRAQTLLRNRIEPKTFYANERTFLSWLSIAVLVVFTALALLDGFAYGSSVVTVNSIGVASTGASTTSNCPQSDRACRAARVCGAILAPVGVLTMVYALIVYRKRTIELLTRTIGRYDDQVGPVVLTCLLVVVTGLAYGFSVAAVF